MNTKASKLLALLPAIKLLVIIFLVFSSEVYTLAVIQDSEIIASYHFGSEAMVNHGGEKYRSVNHYLTSSLILCIGTLAGILISLFVLFRHENNELLKAYAVAIGAAAGAFILGNFI